MNQAARARLDRMINERQALISAGTLEGELTKLDKEFPEEELDNDPSYYFLTIVVLYDRAAKEKINAPGVYSSILSCLEEVDRDTPVLSFYVPNYAFLCARNAGDYEAAAKYFQEAMDAAPDLPEIERTEALGHLLYNKARLLHKRGKRDEEAASLWKQAAVCRLQFLRNLNDAGESHDRRLAAAQQIWKMRGDFEKFFPDQGIEECGVTAKTIAELEEQFGDAVKSFSAKPS